MGFTRDQAVANLMSSFERIWHDFWGPRMAYFLRNVCLLLYTLNERLVQEGRAGEQFTLLDINPLLQYEEYATLVLNQLDMSETWHQEPLAWWKDTYFTLPKNSSFRQEVILPILSKMGVFNDNQQLRRIVGQPVTRAPIHEAVTAGKIVLCALSSRDMDDAAVNILGSTLINLLRRSFRLQETVPFQERRKVFLAIDEFQAFSGADIGKLLSEDSKFGCAALLATQFLKQLNTVREGLLDTVLGNCENLCAFNVSASDAKILEEELQKKLDELGGKWGRYLDVDGDAIPYRTLPGDDSVPAYFTRGSGHDAMARYSERPEDYKATVDRLARKYETAKKYVPAPVIDRRGSKIGFIAYGTTDFPLQESRDQLRPERNVEADYESGDARK